MNLSLKDVAIFALVVFVAYLPTFLLCSKIDGDEWVKSGAGVMGLALIALLGKAAALRGDSKKERPRDDDY